MDMEAAIPCESEKLKEKLRQFADALVSPTFSGLPIIKGADSRKRLSDDLSTLLTALDAATKRAEEAEHYQKANYDDATRLTAERQAAEARATKAEEALSDIVNPVAAMQRDAEARGCELDGYWANKLARDPEHLRSIARSALSQTQGERG